MIILMLNQVRRVTTEEARQAVPAELGDTPAQTVWYVGENFMGMEYIQWKLGDTPYHLGTSSEPYILMGGEAQLDEQSQEFGPVKWRMREEVPPETEPHRSAWMSHVAYLYIESLLFHSAAEEGDMHLENVLKIARNFVDERCVLLWHWGGEPKRVALPTPKAIASLRNGHWPN